jgi:subtilisin family serine protease
MWSAKPYFGNIDGKDRPSKADAVRLRVASHGAPIVRSHALAIQRARPSTLIAGRIFGACLLAACLLMISISAPAANLAAQEAEIIWSARAAGQNDAARAQEALFLTLYNTGRLPLRREVIAKGEYPGDTMRRAGAWVGNLSAASDALLCDLNPKFCKRSRKAAGRTELRSDSTHLAGYKITRGTKWYASTGDRLIIPDVQIIQIFRPENGGAFPTGKDALISAEQISRVPACLDKNGNVCVTDYNITSQKSGQAGTQVQSQLRQITKVLPKFSKEPKDAFALVPHLTARISIPETRFSYYAKLPKARKYAFDDPGYKRLLQGIGANIQGKFSGDIKSLPNGEPNFHRQKEVFEQFFNVARHGEPKPHLNGLPITIVVVDHRPNIKHCDFKSARIEMLPVPGTFAPTIRETAVESADTASDATVISASTSGSPPADGAGTTPGPATAATDQECAISESPWLREFHGTHILGLAAARRNHKGGAGLLSHFDNVTFKVIPINIDRLRGDENYVSELAVSLREAIFDHGAKIINLSWAYTPVDGGGQRDDIRELIKQTRNSVVWFAAAGNEGNDANDGVCNTRPACFTHPNVAGIVAVERSDDGAGFKLLGNGTETNIGWEAFDMAAPGRNIWSTVGRNEMAAASGTSQSTIIATSAAALVMSKENLTPRGVIERLTYTSSLVPSLKHGMNGGIVDVSAALNFEHDQLWLNNGCAYIGRALSLKFDDGVDLVSGDFVIDSEDPVTMENLGPVHFNLAETRRLFFDTESDSYIAFFVRASTEVLQRVSGDFGTRRDKRFIRFQITHSRGDNCKRPPQKITASVDEIRDFIRRTRL